MELSPYKKHEKLLLTDGYSTAEAIQNFVLSCYNGSMATFRGDSLRNFDASHYNIFLELATHYYKHGESDPELLRIGEKMCNIRRVWGRELMVDLATHKALSPSDYEEGTESDYYDRLVWLEKNKETMQQAGWIDC